MRNIGTIAEGILPGHLRFMTSQMVDSSLETTRVFWRQKLGLPERYWRDPRPFDECCDELDHEVA